MSLKHSVAVRRLSIQVIHQSVHIPKLVHNSSVVSKYADCFVHFLRSFVRQSNTNMVRMLVAVMCSLALCILYSLRNTMSIAMTVMIEENSSKLLQNESNATENDTHTKQTNLKWDTETQQMILGAFYIGYGITPIPGGWLAGRIGGKWVICCIVAGSSALSAVIPWLSASHQLLTVIKILDGLLQGSAMSAIYVILSKWAPPDERSSMISISTIGMDIGSATSYYIAALICNSKAGWPFSFYFYSILGCVWCVLWILLIYESPNEHPLISTEEKKYINTFSNTTRSSKVHSVPWLCILTSPAFIALYFSMTSYVFSAFSLLINVPLYYNSILQYDLKTAGILTALPNLVATVLGFVSGFAADFIISGSYLSITYTRKVLAVLSTGASSIFLFFLANVTDNPSLCTVLLTIAWSCHGFCFPGVLANVMDISPIYSGIIMGFLTSSTSYTGFVGSFFLGKKTKYENTIHQWNKFFFLLAVVQLIGTVVFLIFGDGEEQDWSKTNNNVENEETLLMDKRKPVQED